MSTKYEVIEIDGADITVDISLLAKADELFFNGTEMAKSFDNKPDNYLRLDSTKKYIDALNSRFPDLRNDIVRTKRGGKY